MFIRYGAGVARLVHVNRGKATHLSVWNVQYMLMPTYKDEEWIRGQYVDDGLTQQEIAEKAGCSQHTISRWLRHHDIETRGSGDYVGFPSPMFHPKGYIEFRDQSGGNDDRFYHHRLLAVSEYGFSAVEGKDVHHINGCGWDNRPDNIELMKPNEHYSKERKREIESGVNLEKRFNGTN